MTTRSTEEAIQYAAATLPEGWNILIDIERDAGCVRLFDSEGDELDIDGADLSIARQIEQAVTIALEGEGLEVPA